MKSRSLTSLYSAAAIGTFLLTSSAFAQPVEWSGGGLTTSNAWTTPGNWASGAAPAAGSNISIATGNFTPATNATDTMSLSSSPTVGSITFNNNAGQFPTTLRLNANSGNGNNGGAARVLTINRDASNVVFSVVNSANVFISGNSSTLNNFAGLNLTLNYTGTGAIHVDGTSSLSIGGNATTFRAVAGKDAGLEKTGGGTLILSGVSSNYTGGFQLTGGTLLVSASSNLTNAAQPGPFGTGSLTINGGTKLASTLTSSNGNRTFDNAVIFTGGTVTLGDTTNNGVISFTTGVNTNPSASAFQGNTVLNVLSSVTVNRNMGGSGSLTKSGAGTLTLSGTNNTYSGGTTVNEGIIRGHLGTGALSVASGATYVLNGADRSIAALSGAGSVTLGANTLTTSSSANSTFSGVLSGAGGLTKSGAGTLTLSGANDYTGSTSVTAGVLSLGASNSLADVSNVILSGGTLATNSFTDSMGTLSLLGNSIIDFTGGGSFAFANSAAATWTGGMTLSLTSGFVSGSSLRFGSDASGLGVSQLAQISATGFDTFSLDSSGYLVGSAAAIPEPSTYAAMAGLAALGCAFWRRRRATLAQRRDV